LRISLAFRWSRFRLGILAARLGGGRNTVARILVDAGLQPAPERKRQPQWKEFLTAHFCEMAATDFFTVEVLTAFGIDDQQPGGDPLLTRLRFGVRMPKLCDSR
jgi:hypothetical protein